MRRGQRCTGRAQTETRTSQASYDDHPLQRGRELALLVLVLPVQSGDALCFFDVDSVALGDQRREQRRGELGPERVRGRAKQSRHARGRETSAGRGRFRLPRLRS